MRLKGLVCVRLWCHRRTHVRIERLIDLIARYDLYRKIVFFREPHRREIGNFQIALDNLACGNMFDEFGLSVFVRIGGIDPLHAVLRHDQQIGSHLKGPLHRA